MKKCVTCHTYTISERCLKCGGETVTVHPARFSPDDRYARYRSQSAYEV